MQWYVVEGYVLRAVLFVCHCVCEQATTRNNCGAPVLGTESGSLSVCLTIAE